MALVQLGGVMMLGNLPDDEKVAPRQAENGTFAKPGRLNATGMMAHRRPLEQPLLDAMAMSALAGSVPVILYRRRNLVRTCVSRLFHRSGSHMFGTQRADRLRTLQQTRLSTTAAELLGCVALEAASQARYVRMVAAPELVADLRWMTIVYEDLLADATAGLHAESERAALFLTLGKATVVPQSSNKASASSASPMLRIHVGSIMQYLDANVTETALRAAFDGTPWEWLLHEALSGRQSALNLH